MSNFVDTGMLAPGAALVAWTLVMTVWVVLTRFPAFKQVGLDLSEAAPGARYPDVEPMIPAQVNWKAHNLNHLMEQPTVFYPVIVILALVGGGSAANVYWAWAYVGLRIAHSLWQSLVNTVPVRFALFTASSICLAALAIDAVRNTLL